MRILLLRPPLRCPVVYGGRIDGIYTLALAAGGRRGASA